MDRIMAGQDYADSTKDDKIMNGQNHTPKTYDRIMNGQNHNPKTDGGQIN